MLHATSDYLGGVGIVIVLLPMGYPLQYTVNDGSAGFEAMYL